MNAMQWTLVTGGYLIVLYLALRWLRKATRLPIPGRAQEARKIARRQTGLDIDEALDRAMNVDSDRGADRPGAATSGLSHATPALPDRGFPPVQHSRHPGGPRPLFLGARR